MWPRDRNTDCDILVRLVLCLVSVGGFGGSVLLSGHDSVGVSYAQAGSSWTVRLK
jgi:hypothetical protein